MAVDYKYYEVHICNDIDFISNDMSMCIAFILDKCKTMLDVPLSEFELKMFEDDSDCKGRVIWRADWYLSELDGKRM